MLVVDAANVVGSRPDGWWRDRAAAADRLVAQIEAAIDSGRVGPPVVVVLEGRARGAAADPGTSGHLTVIRAPGSGDDRIVELAAAAVAQEESVTVVTADRGLTERLRSVGAQVERPRQFLERLGVPPSPDPTDRSD